MDFWEGPELVHTAFLWLVALVRRISCVEDRFRPGLVLLFGLVRTISCVFDLLSGASSLREAKLLLLR